MSVWTAMGRGTEGDRAIMCLFLTINKSWSHPNQINFFFCRCFEKKKKSLTLFYDAVTWNLRQFTSVPMKKEIEPTLILCVCVRIYLFSISFSYNICYYFSFFFSFPGPASPSLSFDKPFDHPEIWTEQTTSMCRLCLAMDHFILIKWRIRRDFFEQIFFRDNQIKQRFIWWDVNCIYNKMNGVKGQTDTWKKIEKRNKDENKNAKHFRSNLDTKSAFYDCHYHHLNEISKFSSDCGKTNRMRLKIYQRMCI